MPRRVFLQGDSKGQRVKHKVQSDDPALSRAQGSSAGIRRRQTFARLPFGNQLTQRVVQTVGRSDNRSTGPSRHLSTAADPSINRQPCFPPRSGSKIGERASIPDDESLPAQHEMRQASCSSTARWRSGRGRPHHRHGLAHLNSRPTMTKRPTAMPLQWLGLHRLGNRLA